MNNDNHPSENELPVDARVIAERIRYRPIPQDSLDRVLASAATLAEDQPRLVAACSDTELENIPATAGCPGAEDTESARPMLMSKAQLRTMPNRRRLLWFGLPAAIAATVLVLLAIIIPSEPTLAQVLSATMARPWLHGELTYTQADRRFKTEFWFSRESKVFANRVGSRLRYVRFRGDLGQNTSEEYDAGKGTIVKRRNVHLRLQDAGLLLKLLQGDAELANVFVAKERLGESPDFKKTPHDLERFRVRLQDGNNRAVHQIAVDRETGLLHSWNVKHQDGLEASVTFDYPQKGPESIYAMGAPKSAAIVDLAEKLLSGRSLEVVPTQGVGKIRFRMKEAEVCEILGSPTKEVVLGSGSVKELIYAEYGLVLLVHKQVGVGSIQCCSSRYGRVYGVEMNSFPGKTKEKIGIGSSRAELIAAYGEPQKHNKDGSVGYVEQQIGYEFVDDRIARFGMRAASSACRTDEG